MVPITVVTIMYNTPEAYLRQAVESVLNQTFTDFEYIVFDNASTDGSLDVVKEYEAKDSRVRVVEIGYNYYRAETAELRLEGLKKVAEYFRRKYVCCLDSDDWYESDFLELAYALAEKHNADIVAGDFELHNEETPEIVCETWTCKRTSVAENAEEVVDFWIKNYANLRAWWNKLYRSGVWKKHWLEYKLDDLLGFDNYMNQCIIPDCRVAVAIGRVTHHYRIRFTSYSNVLTPEMRLITKHVDKYNHAMGILTGTNSINEERVAYLKELLKVNVFGDDFIVMIKARKDYPLLTMRFLELIFTEPTMYDVVKGFTDENEKYLDGLFGLAIALVDSNHNANEIVNSFVTKLAIVWMRTNKLTKADKLDIINFIGAVFDERNVNHVGRDKLERLFKAYDAPFSSSLALLCEAELTDTEFLNCILKRKSPQILERLISVSFISDNAELFKSIYDEISVNDDIKTLPTDFLKDFPRESSLIYHGKQQEAADSLEDLLTVALNSNDAISAERILVAILRVAIILDDARLFTETRIRRLELFVITKQREKAKNEYETLKGLLSESQMKELEDIPGLVDMINI